MKCDKNPGPAIIECGVYIEMVLIEHLYQRDTYLYLPPSLAASKMASLKVKVGSWIKQHSKKLTRIEKLFLTTNLEANVDPFQWFYGMMKTHKTLWTMRPTISFTGSLMHPIGVWTDSKFQQVVADIPAYVKDSNVLKEKLATMYLPPGTMLLMVDANIIYKKIQT